MFEAFIIIIACAFTLYGLYRMSYAMKCNLEKTRLCEHRDEAEKEGNSSRSRYFLLVKNCDYNVEWLVRSFYHSNVDAAVTNPGLTVIDCASEDDTKKIIEVMKNKYEDLQVMSMDEFERFLKSSDDKV